MTLTEQKYQDLVKDLTEGAREAFSEAHLGDFDAPKTYEDFERAMWVEDLHMHTRGATREEYTDAMKAAYAAWRDGKPTNDASKEDKFRAALETIVEISFEELTSDLQLVGLMRATAQKALK